jgi:transposase
MPLKLSQEDIVALHVLKARGQSNMQIGKGLGVTEGTVRYRCKRRAEGKLDGRADKAFKVEPLAAVIDHWTADHAARQADSSRPRPLNVKLLYEHLVAEHDYAGSYRSVLRFVRAKYPRPKIRPFRRIETPPGAQAQIDWSEFSGIDIGNGPQTLYGFFMVLSHSRKEELIWSSRMDQVAWHTVHNEGFRRLGGIPAVLRMDNLKTAIARGAGPWGEVNQAYRSYSRAVGFHVDACLPRAPEDKGKVESRIGHTQRRIDPRHRRFDSLADLQAWTDQRLELSATRRLCPATGRSVHETWLEERRHLQTLPILPMPFDVAVTRPVQRDCLVNFEGRSYSVPFVLVGKTVEVRGCAEVIQFFHDGRMVAEHLRHTRERLLIEPSHYEGPGNDRVEPPVPLGKLGRRLQEIVTMPVEQRPLDLYAALAEVSR